MKLFIAPIAFALLVAVVALPAHSEDQQSARIGTSEDLEDHQGYSEELEDHEGKSGQIEDHEATSRSVDDLVVESETISEHQATSETTEGRIVRSERLDSAGATPTNNLDSLDEARAKLRAARESHAPRDRAAPQQPAALEGSASTSSGSTDADYAKWTSRIDVANKQIDVARASAAVWDENYADMIRDNYPRGDERQRLIDSRDQSHEHVAAEQARLTRMIEDARRAGVPAGVLERYSDE